MRNWTEMYRESRSNVSIRSLAFSQFAPYQVYLAESNGDILRSFDSGHSWSVLRRFNTRVLRIIPSPLKQGLVYMITQKDGLYRSLDGGESWKSLKKGLSTYSGGTQFRKHLLHAVNPETIYWVSKYGILRSDDMGDSWTPMKLITAPGGANIYGFAVNPQNDNEIYYTATIGTRSTFYKTADGGQNWVTKKLPSGQVPTVLRVHPSNPNMLYLGLTIPPSK